MATNFIGGSVLRLEDPTLIRGRGRFAADINFPHQLHIRVVRSTRAHGKNLSIDTSLALAHPGVMAVWTSADVRKANWRVHLKPDDALSEPRRKGVNEWYDNSLLTRLNDKATGCIIIIMQR